MPSDHACHLVGGARSVVDYHDLEAIPECLPRKRGQASIECLGTVSRGDDN
jgi:hypothetical protein